MAMDIPCVSPIKFDDWSKMIQTKVEEIEDKGLVVCKVVMHPKTLGDVKMFLIKKNPPLRLPTITFCGFPLSGDPDIHEREFELQVSL